MNSTRNYEKFNFLQGNREVDENHVNTLINSISQKNLLQHNPILVSDEMTVIDGQHRLLAARKLKTPIYYEIVDSDNLETVLLLNNNSKKWSIADYVNSYISMGNESYKELRDFKEKNGLSYSIAAYVLNQSIRGRELKEGKFYVKDIVVATEVMHWINALSQYVDESYTPKHRSFIYAVTNLVKNPEITLEALIRKIKIGGAVIHRKNDTKSYMSQFEDIYNYMAKKRTTLY